RNTRRKPSSSPARAGRTRRARSQPLRSVFEGALMVVDAFINYLSFLKSSFFIKNTANLTIKYGILGVLDQCCRWQRELEQAHLRRRPMTTQLDQVMR